LTPVKVLADPISGGKSLEALTRVKSGWREKTTIEPKHKTKLELEH